MCRAHSAVGMPPTVTGNAHVGCPPANADHTAFLSSDLEIFLLSKHLLVLLSVPHSVTSEPETTLKGPKKDTEAWGCCSTFLQRDGTSSSLKAAHQHPLPCPRYRLSESTSFIPFAARNILQSNPHLERRWKAWEHLCNMLLLSCSKEHVSH